MKRFLTPKYVVIYVIAIIVVIDIGIVTFSVRSASHNHAPQKYDGKKTALISPTPKDNLQIENAVMNMSSRLPSDVQVGVQVIKYTGTVAQGYATYSKGYPAVLFMAVKNGNHWLVIDHTTNKALPLPNLATAKKYNLPKGWYKNS